MLVAKSRVIVVVGIMGVAKVIQSDTTLHVSHLQICPVSPWPPRIVVQLFLCARRGPGGAAG